MDKLKKIVAIVLASLIFTSLTFLAAEPQGKSVKPVVGPTEATRQPELTTSQIVKKYSPSVVTIVALDQNDQPLSLGSGFFINAEGDVASNHHVLEGSSKAIIRTMDGRTGEVLEIINDDPELDLLIAKSSLKSTNPLPLGDSDTITVGEEITAIGNPAGLEGTISNGIISGIRKMGKVKLIQITAPISPGSSGGPVFNKSGRVIGIATAYLDIGQNLNFAMPINYLKSLTPSRIKLGSLPKMVSKTGTVEKNVTLVKIFNVGKTYYPKQDSGDIIINFAIRNSHEYPIKNIKLLFIYKNSKKEVITYSAKEINDLILPHLALQFSHKHFVRYFCDAAATFHPFDDSLCGDVEIRILDYQIDRRTSPTDLLFK